MNRFFWAIRYEATMPNELAKMIRELYAENFTTRGEAYAALGKILDYADRLSLCAYVAQGFCQIQTLNEQSLGILILKIRSI